MHALPPPPLSPLKLQAATVAVPPLSTAMLLPHHTQHHLQRALELSPAAALPRFLLCHTLVLLGRWDEAVAAAHTGVDASAGSPESLSLLALLLQLAPPVHGGDDTTHARCPSAPGTASSELQQLPVAARVGSSEAMCGESQVPALCLAVLRRDPWSLGAVQGACSGAVHRRLPLLH
jgi:hypothetical protein